MPRLRAVPRLQASAAGVALVIGAAAASAQLRWRSNPDPTAGRPLELPEGRERSVTSPDGTVLACWEMGDPDGPLVLFGHGWTADRRVWAATARRLVPLGLRVVAFDQRGHGRSSVGSGGLTVPAMGEDLLALIEGLDAGGRGRPGAVVVGHSMGGMAAQAFAVTHPGVLARRVRHLVLVATAARRPTYGAPGSPLERAALAATAAPVLQAAMRSAVVGPYLVRGSFGRRPSLAALSATHRSVADTRAATRRDFLRDMGALDLVDSVSGLRVATTVVWGTADRLTLPGLNRQIAESIPGARAVVVEQAGHQIPFEAPDRLAEVIAAAIG